MNLKKQLTTAGMEHTAKKQEVLQVCRITPWLIPAKVPELKVFAVPAVFAVVEQRFPG
jgi:hypothetical protein